MRLPPAVLACACLTLAGCADPETTAPLAAGAELARGPSAAAAAFPDVVPLPTGFAPEGIASGRGSTLYVGSISLGAIYQADARTGEGSLLVAPDADRQAVGMTYDGRRDRLFVAGGLTGQAYVYDASTGATLAVYQLTAPGMGLVNDVALLRDAAYFTESFGDVLYRVPLERNGALGDPADVQAIPLGGDFEFVPGDFNLNGIVAAPGDKALIAVNTATGRLYRIDPETGVTTEIPLAGGSLVAGDGLALVGHTLYVVQGALDQVTVVRLSPHFTSGEIDRVITDPGFRFPSTVAVFGSSLYVVNARFDVAPPPAPAPGVEFEVVRVPR